MPWSTTLLPGDLLSQDLFDGIYSADANNRAAPDAIESVIVAQHETPFEVVGLAFNDVNSQLVAEPFFISIAQELQAEQAGLQILSNDGLAPNKLGKLLDDVGQELKVLNFTPQSVGYADPKTIAKIEQIQEKMADLVHSTPKLVAQLPDGIGWSSPAVAKTSNTTSADPPLLQPDNKFVFTNINSAPTTSGTHNGQVFDAPQNGHQLSTEVHHPETLHAQGHYIDHTIIDHGFHL